MWRHTLPMVHTYVTLKNEKLDHFHQFNISVYACFQSFQRKNNTKHKRVNTPSVQKKKNESSFKVQQHLTSWKIDKKTNFDNWYDKNRVKKRNICQGKYRFWGRAEAAVAGAKWCSPITKSTKAPMLGNVLPPVKLWQQNTKLLVSLLPGLSMR